MKRFASYFYMARMAIYFLAGYAAIFSAALISWPYKIWVVLGSMAIAGMTYAAGEAAPVDVDDLEKLACEMEQKEAARKEFAIKNSSVAGAAFSDEDDNAIDWGKDDSDLMRANWDMTSPLYHVMRSPMDIDSEWH
ncbi:MAG: hypothetical protein ACK4JF_08425 [Methylohalobius sp.]